MTEADYGDSTLTSPTIRPSRPTCATFTRCLKPNSYGIDGPGTLGGAFGHNESRVELLNSSAPTCFYELQFLWFDYIILEICRITDPVETCRCPNLVITQLRQRLNQTKYSKLADQLSKLRKHCQRGMRTIACSPQQEGRPFRPFGCSGHKCNSSAWYFTPGNGRCTAFHPRVHERLSYALPPFGNALRSPRES